MPDAPITFADEDIEQPKAAKAAITFGDEDVDQASPAAKPVSFSHDEAVPVTMGQRRGQSYNPSSPSPAEQLGIKPPSVSMQEEPLLPGAFTMPPEEKTRAEAQIASQLEATRVQPVKDVTGVEGYPAMANAVEQYKETFDPTKFSTEDAASKARWGAGAELLGGAATAATPLAIAVGGAAPLQVARGLLTGYGASKVGGAIAHHEKASPEAEEFVRQVAYFVPAALGIAQGLAKPKVGAVSTPEGQAVAGEAFGGRVRAGVARTPEGVGGGVQVGRFKVGRPVPGRSAAPAVEPPTIEGEPPAPVSPGERAANAAVTAKAQRDLLGKAGPQAAEIATAAATPPPEPNVIGDELKPQTLEAIGGALAKLPEAERPQALIHAQEKLAKQLLDRGKIVGPDGKLIVVKTEEQAQNAATKLLNDHVAPARDKAVQQAAASSSKPSEKRVTQKPVASTEKKLDVQPLGKASGAAAAPAKAPIVIDARDISSSDTEVPLHGEGTAKYPEGKLSKESDTRRDVIQPDQPADKLNAMAKEVAPHYETALKDALKGVPDAQFERIRPEKNPARLKQKIEGEDQPPSTVPDYLAGQATFDTPQGKEAAIAAIEKNFNVIRKVDLTKDGDPDYHYRHVAFQLEMPNGLTAELHVLPREVYDFNKEEHAEYKAARNAEIQGDQETFKIKAAEAREANDEAYQKYLDRVGGEAGNKEVAPEKPASQNPTNQGAKGEATPDKSQGGVLSAPDYAAGKKLFPQQKAALSRALAVKEPEARKAAVIAAATKAVNEWEEKFRYWPDDWSRWQRAIDDAHKYNERGPRLEDLVGKAAQAKPEVQSPGISETKKVAYTKGDRVVFSPQGGRERRGTVVYVSPTMNIARVKEDGANTFTVNPKALRRESEEKVAPPEQPASTIEKAEHEPPAEHPAEGGREVRSAESQGGTPPARIQPQAGEVPREGREPEPDTRLADGERSESPAAVGSSESGAGPGGGAGDAGDLDATRRPAERGRGESKPRVVRNADWFAHPDDWTVETGTKTRLNNNLRALKLVHEALTGEHKLTDGERAALAQYVGWGSLQWVFDPWRAPYGDQQTYRTAYDELRKLLSDDEFDAARKSTMNAHYTSAEVVRFMWDAVKAMDFKGGTVLEPAMGTGNFFGMMPKALRAKIHAIGNELDPTTFNISKLLYPSATLFNKDFSQLILPDNSIDLAIGNVPFGEEIYDPHYPKLKARIHDYFLVKSLDKLRPGGVAMFITSTGTLDKPQPRIRDIMASKADLVFAVRMPSSTFEKSAGTHVTTDLLVFQKRALNAEPGGEAFAKVVPVEAMHEQDKVLASDYLNEYYDKHPENLLGDLTISRRMYGSNDLVLAPKKDAEFADLLKDALARVPKGLFDNVHSAPAFPAADATNLAPDTVVEGGYFLDDKGNVRQRQNGGTLLDPPAVYDKQGKKSPVLVDRLKKLVSLKSELNELLGLMKTVAVDDVGNRMIETQQKRLLKAYREYTAKHGLLNDRRAAIMAEDPHFPRLLALEYYNKTTKKATLAEIFTKRTILPRQPLQSVSKDPKEALYQVLNERGTPDLEFMATLSDKSVDELAEELGKQGLIFKDPVGGGFHMRETYLSGYVRDKLADAVTAVEQGMKEYQRNVDALTKVIPKDVPIKDLDPKKQITIQPGATWIPKEAIEDFVQHTFGTSGTVTHLAGSWSVNDANRTANIVAKWGNEEFPADFLLQESLNLHQATAWDRYIEDGVEKRKVNQERTAQARELQAKLNQEFARYLRESDEWAPKLEKIYNHTFNNLATPEHDGSHLTFPGMNTSVLRGGKLMPHQANAIWRLVQDGRGLLAHVVGAGKTYEMIAAGMEMKRLGMIKKPLYAVPNHLVGQWGEAFATLYPGSNVLVTQKDDFKPENRKRMMARVATSEWDAIVMAHSQFNLMDISPERQKITIRKDLDELEETIRGLQAESKGGSSYGRRHKEQSRVQKRTIKQMEKSKAILEAKIAALADLKADRTINFDDTGIDHLFVDEAHEYKNLLFYTKMSRVAGLSQGNAMRATRLKMKTDYLLEKNRNRGVVFATGTPIQNTMAEMYNMTRYVAPDVFEKAGIKYFDDWAANFGSIITAMELGADAASYHPRAKFAEFNNLPELQLMFTAFADVKTVDDLPELKAVLPTLEGGKPILVEIDNPEIDPLIKQLIRRAAAIRGEGVPIVDEHGKPVLEEYKDEKTGQMKKRQAMEHPPRPKPEEDNMLNVVNDGRKGATDLRLLYPDNSGKYGKIAQSAKLIYEEWRKGSDKRLTQLVFLDRYRRTEGKTESLNLYHDLTAKLVAMGIPKDEIAVVHDSTSDEAKLKLFEAVNAGNIRILIGSTQKMGAGMNVQRKLVAEHHFDLPWKPGELEQREGRIMRQGNENKVVRIYYHLTKNSFDAYMAQTLQTKAKFIWQAMSGKNVGRSITDAASDAVLSYEEMKAIASGNPDVKTKMELEVKKRRLEMLERQHYAAIKERQGLRERLENSLGNLHAALEAKERALKQYEDAKGADGEQFALDILGKKFTERKAAMAYLEKEDVPALNFHISLNGMAIPVRTFNDFQRPVMEYLLPYPSLYRVQGGDVYAQSGYHEAPERSLQSLVSSIEAKQRFLVKEVPEAKQAVQETKEKIAGVKDITASAFPEKEQLAKVERELTEVNQRLGIDELAGAAEQDVTVDPDSLTDEDEPTQFGTFPFPTDTFQKFYDMDVAPKMQAFTHGLAEIADTVLHGIFPRAQVPGLGGPEPGVVDKFMEMKGNREHFLGKLDLALEGWEKFFDRLPQAELVDFLDRYKTGQPQRTSALNDLAAFFKRIDDGVYQSVTQFKPSLKYKENHFRIFWKVIPGQTGKTGRGFFASKRPFQGSKGFMKHATLADVSEGLIKGGVPHTFNPVKMFKRGIADSMQYVTAQNLWQDIGPNALNKRKFVRFGQRPPDDYVKVDDRIASVYFRAASDEGMVNAGEWYVEKNTARLLNRFLSRDWFREASAGRGLMWLKNATTAVELGLSPFHAVFETIEAMGSMVGVGTMRAWNLGVLEGDPVQLGKGLVQIAKAPIAPVTLALEGGDVLRYLRSQSSAPLPPLPKNPVLRYFANRKQLLDATRVPKFVAKNPNVVQAIDDLFAGGGKLKMHEDFRVDTLSSFLENWRAENYIGAGLRLIPAVTSQVMKPLFDHYIPRLKLGLFLEQFGEQLEENSDKLAAGDVTRSEIARKVWDSVEDRFGEMNFDNLFWNRGWKTTFQFAFRSVTWKFGFVRGAGGAIGGQANQSFFEPIRLLKGQGPAGERAKAASRAALKLDMRLAWLLGVAATTVVLSSLITRWRTGKWPWEFAEEADSKLDAAAELLREFSHPRWGGEDDHGKPNRLTVPTYFRDVEGIANSPTRYIASSQSGLVARSLEAWNNENFYGDYVFDPNEPTYQKLLDGFAHAIPRPIAYEGYKQQQEQAHGDRTLGYLNFLGFARARRDLDYTPAEKLMQDLKRESRPPRTPQQVEESREKRQAFEEGRLPLAEMRKMSKADREDWSLRTFKSLPYYQAREVFERGNATEQALWLRTLMEKRRNLLHRNPAKLAAEEQQ